MDHLVTERIAIIPARGGSKRIPRKNIVDFLGKPMIAWTIEAAINSGCFSRILVSTEDPEVASVAKSWGAEVPFLRTSHTDDISPVSQATQAALTQASNYWREDYKLVVQLMANCPLRDSGDIQHAVSAFEAKSRRFQISCFKFGWMNPWWAAEVDDQGQPNRLFPDTAGERSQDLPDLYCPSGAIWVANVPEFLEQGTFYGDDHRFEAMQWQSAVDIDDYQDFAFAKAVAQGMSLDA